MALAAMLAVACSDDDQGLPTNAACTNNSDCADRVCHDGQCASSAPAGAGAACQGNGDCKSYNCVAGVCAVGKRKDGETCVRAVECRSGYCNAQRKCGFPPRLDAGVPDLALPDSALPDAPRPDRLRPDAPLPDAPVPDAPVPDAPAPDLALPDLTPPDQLQPDASLCGNGKLDPTELCDGALLGGKTCKTQGFTGGALACKGCKLDTLRCYEIRDPAGIKVAAGQSYYRMATPKVASDGSGFLVVMWGPGGGGSPVAPWINAALVDASGKASASFYVANTSPKKKMPDVAFGGKDYLVTWEQGNAIRGTTVSTTGKVGNPVGTILLQSSAHAAAMHYPSLAFDGTNFLVAAWLHSGNQHNSPKQLLGRRVSPAGATLGTTIKVNVTNHKSGVPDRPTLAFDGLSYKVAWTNNADLYLSRISSAGVRLNSADEVISKATAEQRQPAAASNGKETFLAWMDAQSSGKEINSATVSTTGTVSKPAWVSVNNYLKTMPAVATDGTHYLVVYQEKSWLRAVRLDSSGTQLEPPFQLTSSAGAQEIDPAVAYGGGQFLVVWTDYRTSKSSIYGTRLRFGKAP